MDARTLRRRSFLGLLQLQVILAALLFVPAWTVRWWQGWAAWSLFGGASLAITLWLLRRDPALIERRLAAGPGAEKRGSQKVIQAVAGLLWIATWLVPALDRRSGWSAVPTPAIVIGDALIVAGMAVVFLAFRENSFASAAIDVHAGQTVVTTGPYRIVRHPMYAGAMPLVAGTPLALGSWWGLVPAALLCVAIVVRLLDEERLLEAELHGYGEYCRAVRYRLVPGVW